jgi:hypothetical protein
MLLRYLLSMEKENLVSKSPTSINPKVETKTPEIISYPIPCGFCNTLAQDVGLDPNTLLIQGFLVIKDGQVVQIKHLGRCPDY